jgi:hypothetical protein
MQIRRRRHLPSRTGLDGMNLVQSETLRTWRSSLHGTWEVSPVSGLVPVCPRRTLLAPSRRRDVLTRSPCPMAALPLERPAGFPPPHRRGGLTAFPYSGECAGRRYCEASVVTTHARQKEAHYEEFRRLDPRSARHGRVAIGLRASRERPCLVRKLGLRQRAAPIARPGQWDLLAGRAERLQVDLAKLPLPGDRS